MAIKVKIKVAKEFGKSYTCSQARTCKCGHPHVVSNYCFIHTLRKTKQSRFNSLQNVAKKRLWTALYLRYMEPPSKTGCTWFAAEVSNLPHQCIIILRTFAASYIHLSDRFWLVVPHVLLHNGEKKYKLLRRNPWLLSE